MTLNESIKQSLIKDRFFAKTMFDIWKETKSLEEVKTSLKPYSKLITEYGLQDHINSEYMKLKDFTKKTNQ